MNNEKAMVHTTMPHRVLCLEKWLHLRNFDIQSERNDFLCIYYCTMLSYLKSETAKQFTREINNKLTAPLSDSFLNKYICGSIDKKESLLRFTNTCIKVKLGMTDTEYNSLEFDVKKNDLERRAKNRSKRNERNDFIRQLYRQGKSKTEIQEETNTSIRQIERIIAPIAAAGKDIRNLKIQQLHKEGKTNTEIAEEMHCSRDTVSSVLRSENSTKRVSDTKKEKGTSSKKNTIPNTERFYAMYSEQAAMESCKNVDVLSFLSDSRDNLLITGSAGTGKSYLLRQYVKSLSPQDRKKVLITAPTWKAAQNLDGITIHKAFGLNTAIQNTAPVNVIPPLLHGIETLIIDEISMLRIDVFNKVMQTIDYIEEECSYKIRIIGVGDFGQLQPVADKEDMAAIRKLYPDAAGVYCFQSAYWDTLHFKRITLHEIYRQLDPAFSDTLTKLKYGCTDTISWFNNHCDTDFDRDAITIVPTNDLVSQYNEKKISELTECVFQEYPAFYRGELPPELPAPETLKLAVDCRIMVLRNGSKYKNGQLGTVAAIEESCLKVCLDDSPDTVTSIPKVSWTLENGTKYTQFPVCLAYAITVNKAQGCTFDSINIDRGNGFFLPGHLYVALSRCRTVKGIHLVTKLKEKDVYTDEEALKMTLC